jgi:hypothetical protein
MPPTTAHKMAGDETSAQAAEFLFESWASTLNRYIFAILPVIAVLGTFRASRRRFQVLHNIEARQAGGGRGVGGYLENHVRTGAHRIYDIFMVFFFPVPPRTPGMFTNDTPSIYAHGVEYLVVFCLDIYALSHVAAAGISEIHHGDSWAQSRGLNIVMLILVIYFLLRCGRLVASVVLQRMGLFDALFDRMLLLLAKFLCLIAIHTLVKAEAAEAVLPGVLSFATNPADVLVISLGGQLRTAFTEWFGIEIDPEKRTLKQPHAARSGAEARGPRDDDGVSTGGAEGETDALLAYQGREAEGSGDSPPP